MDVNNVAIKDGDLIRPTAIDAPSLVDMPKQKLDGTPKKKRRRGKSKRQLTKPFMKVSWQDRRKNDKNKRNNRFRKIVLANTHAPFNNNQFLMEIHKPEPENNFHVVRTPSARTRDSSFSVDSEENYFYSLPEDEEEYLTKEFSSVYEDAQSERLSSMSKDEIIQEYLLLEAKYDNLVKRTERMKPRCNDEDKDIAEKDTSFTDRESMVTDRDISANSVESSAADESSVDDVMQRLKEQEDKILELQLANEKLILENEHLRIRSQNSSSEDSESDSSSTSVTSSCSSRSRSPVNVTTDEVNGDSSNIDHTNDHNGVSENPDPELTYPLVNGFHSPSD